MNDASGFRWQCLKVGPGSHYKFTDLSQWKADPWARSYTYDNFGEMSLVKPTVSHLDRHIGVGDAVMEERTVRVWVPEAGHDRVLYVHDGQNLFSPDAFFGGWKLQESAPTGILLVGIDNTPARMDEYTHNEDFVLGELQGGEGDAYADFLKNTVRPLIQKHYGEKGPIGVMGSSLGGLISFHIANYHKGDYAFAASLSGTMGWGSIGTNNETMIERYQKAGHQSTFLYLDSGGGGDTCADADMDGTNDDDPMANDNYCENIQMRDVLLSIGYTTGVDMAHWFEPDAPHNEAAWAARVFRPLDIFRDL
jgi:predicted alpha/beta superfamily hydrolase